MLKATMRFLLCGLVSFGLPTLWAQERPQAAIASAADSGALPDSPGASRSASLSLPGQAFSQTDQAAEQPGPSPATQQTSSVPQKPVGTAAAEAPPASGIAASQPAGAAIAPAKQRRARTIVLRVGAIVGAGAALGTVLALTEGTSSKPPGAR